MFRGHPKGLIPLFITEAWERFCFYGARSILILYMIGEVSAGGLGWTKGFALKIFGFNLFCAYVATIFGGWIADRFWGQRRAIYVGGALMSAGYFVLAIGGIYSFMMGLGLIALGNGFFKPCATTMFGSLYKGDDPARDSGFSLFYMGVNVGAMLGPFACGSFGFMGTMQYSYGFMVAGFSMIIAMGVFLKGRSQIGNIGLKPKKMAKNERREPLTGPERMRLAAVGILSVLILFFFAAFEQGAGLIAIYTKEYTRLSIGTFKIPVAWFQAVNPFFVITLGPLMAWMWSSFIKKGFNWTVCKKFSLGFFLSAISFTAMMGAAFEYSSVGSSSLSWIMLFYFFVTVGELCLTPILWSNVSRISPKGFGSMMMATTLTCIGVGYWLGGAVGGLIDSLSTMTIFFGVTVTMVVFAGLALAINGLVERLSHGRSRKKNLAAAL